MVDWLAGKRVRGTSSERTGLGTPLAFIDSSVSNSGCKAYYNFEQTSGSLTNQATTGNGFSDGLGSSADGTNSGATTGATGKVGSYAWSFDGSNDYVDLGTPILGASGTTTASFSFWSNLSSTGFVYTDGNYISTSTWATTIEQITNGNMRLFIASSGADGGSNQVTSNVSVSSGWNHWVLTYDGSGSTNTDKIKIYLNGAQVSSTTSSGTIPSSIKTVTPNARIGALYTGSGNYFGGLIDELAIFNRVLTSSEVSNIYNEQVGNPDIQDGTIFEESDTNKAYIWNASTTTWTQL